MNRAFCVHCLRFVSLCVFASTSEQNRPKLCLAQLVAVLICTIHSCVYRAPVRDPLPHLQPSPPITHTKEGIVNTLQAATSGLSESVRGRQGTVVSALGPLYHTHTHKQQQQQKTTTTKQQKTTTITTTTTTTTTIITKTTAVHIASNDLFSRTRLLPGTILNVICAHEGAAPCRVPRAGSVGCTCCWLRG